MHTSPIPAWSGPLDVPAFAMDAVRQAASAAGRLARARGLDISVDTTPSLVAGSFAAIDHLRIDGRPVGAWGELSGFFAADDGWVRLHGNYPHHQAAIRRALGAEDRDGAAAAIRRLPAVDAAERLLAEGGIATPVRTAEDWAAHPQARAMHDVPWRRIDVGEEREDPPVGRMIRPVGRAAPLPLEGVRVLDLTRVVAGPMATQLLGCLGADVLRIDPPHRPELRDAYLASGMGKRSVELDLSASREVLESLLRSADVIVLGYRPGSLARFGLAPDDLRGRFDHLVIGALSAWGEVGPWGERAGFDSIVQAATGIADVYGSGGADGGSDPVHGVPLDRKPGALPVQALDHATGNVLAAGILGLLADGRGGVVRASLLGAARELMERPTAPDDPHQPGPADSGPTDPDPIEPVATLEQATPYGRICRVPAPLRLDGIPLTGAITQYAAAAPAWR
ncbi:CoA transferase [Brachybacterium halotolerans subsp. kimchii]|uniref:CoA transferase n=1 Tax=Brachybacterium halotolerans TaxID=2795215 RepID=UPI001E47B186|nr:CoA transferase [Brachybacterium halotolerans]UEJ81270.1 CoA transferase [Brachybacterium halotolerans subsp. kimchii]